MFGEPYNCKVVYTLCLLYNYVRNKTLHKETMTSTTSRYTTTESGGRQNMFSAETQPWVDENSSYEGYAKNAEKTNGRWAMIGFVALLGAYVTTGQIIPGVF